MNDTMSAPRVLVVLPAYNEEENLGPLLDGLERALGAAGLDWSVLVVDDGSQDGTRALVEERKKSLPLSLVVHPVNRGLAAALRSGLDAALAQAGPNDVVVTLDADNTHPADLIPAMVQCLGRGYDLAIASRFRPGARVVGVPAGRQVLSLGASWIFRGLFPVPGVRDYTCGFRAYRVDFLRRMLADFGDDFISETGFSCMVDVLLKARRYRPRVCELPLVLRYDEKRGASKMQVFKTVWQTLDLVRRRLRDRRDS